MSPALFSQLPPPRESINAQTPGRPGPEHPQLITPVPPVPPVLAGLVLLGMGAAVRRALDYPSTGTAPAVKPLQGRE